MNKKIALLALLLFCGEQAMSRVQPLINPRSSTKLDKVLGPEWQQPSAKKIEKPLVPNRKQTASDDNQRVEHRGSVIVHEDQPTSAQITIASHTFPHSNLPIALGIREHDGNADPYDHATQREYVRQYHLHNSNDDTQSTRSGSPIIFQSQLDREKAARTEKDEIARAISATDTKHNTEATVTPLPFALTKASTETSITVGRPGKKQKELSDEHVVEQMRNLRVGSSTPKSGSSIFAVPKWITSRLSLMQRKSNLRLPESSGNHVPTTWPHNFIE